VVRRFVALAALCLVAGCAAPQIISYYARSYVPVLDDDGARHAHKSPSVEVTDDMDGAAANLYAQGYRLIGYSQFVSPLMPALANVNAKATAKSKGADHVLALQPRAANLDQHYFLATYWRSPEPHAFIFGAYYADPPRPLIAAVGCANSFVAVLDVAAGSPAAQAGIVRGDVIRNVDNRPIGSAAELDRVLIAAAGRTVSITLRRDEQDIAATVMLNRPPTRQTVGTLDGASPPFGIDLEPVKFSKPEQKTYGAKKGYFVGGIEAAQAGCTADLRGGDFIATLEGKPLDSLDRFRKAASRAKPVRVAFVRGQRQYVTQLEPGSRDQDRLALPEASFGAPWRNHAIKDWSGMTAALMIGQSMLEAANSYSAAITEQERASREAYFRSVQTAESHAPTVVEERGRLFVRTGHGYAQIDREDAAALAQHPDAKIEIGRNGRAYLTDSVGKRIYTQSAPRQYVTAPIGAPKVTDGFGEALVKGSIIQAQTAAQFDQFWIHLIGDMATRPPPAPLFSPDRTSAEEEP